MILILDFGSQYTQLIARRIRKMRVYSEIYPYHTDLTKIKKEKKIEGIILSGSPSSVYAENSYKVDKNQLESFHVPILGICYGMQLLGFIYQGDVKPSTSREYGFTSLKIDTTSPLFQGLEHEEIVWMSHGDKLIKLPAGFHQTAESSSSIAGMENPQKKVYAIQFHPEVVHTKKGEKVLENFVFSICNAKADWKMESFIDKTIQDIRETVGNKKVVLGLSGGVDSSTLALLLHKAIGNQLVSVFVNNGVLRKNEPEEICNLFADQYHLNFRYVDASEKFLKKLKNIEDPEKKRKIIGKVFLKVFQKEVQDFDFLAQGTLYPDVIESVSVKGPSDTIKTHHNRVRGVLKLIQQGKVIEPFKELFKDEVREIAGKLGLPAFIIQRHPFPGPGLAIRIIGDVTEKRLKLLKEADSIITEEIKKANLYEKLWQAFGVLLPVKSVGVMGDQRTYENVLAVRIVESLDGMTADWSQVPYSVLNIISNRIINEVRGINRVVYDISSKPPATIEWE